MRPAEKTLQAGPYTVRVQRKAIKNLYLRVDPASGCLLVSAPRHVSDAAILDFVMRRQAWIRRAMDRTKEKAAKPQRTFRDADRRAFRAECAAALERWQPLVGKRCSGFSVRDMKTRWGSCNSRSGHLNFNLKLLDMPRECLDYVVVHELCHLWEPNHSKAFWDHVERVYPDWKRVRKSMR
ncbi:MAG: M48 family metallopeptidase [Firmicutes bacterium]|nr:M48 family metallopeptidase [Bacillota bacterium]